MAIIRTNLILYVVIFLVIAFAVISLSNGTCDGCLARRLVDHGHINYHQEGLALCKELRADGHCQVNGTPDLKETLINILREIYADSRGIPGGK